MNRISNIFTSLIPTICAVGIFGFLVVACNGG